MFVCVLVKFKRPSLFRSSSKYSSLGFSTSFLCDLTILNISCNIVSLEARFKLESFFFTLYTFSFHLSLCLLFFSVSMIHSFSSLFLLDRLPSSPLPPSLSHSLSLFLYLYFSFSFSLFLSLSLSLSPISLAYLLYFL